MIKKATKKAFVLIIFLIFGIIGGFFWQALILPYLAQKPQFQDFYFVRRFREREIHIYPQQEIIIRENQALADSIEKIKGSIVFIEAKTKNKETIYGSGVVLTNDGLIITLAELIPDKGTVLINGNNEKIEIIKKDKKKNLALLRIENNQVFPCPFASENEIVFGQRVFVAARFSVENQKPGLVVNEGIIRYFEPESISTNINESPFFKGSGLFNIEGELLGINFVDDKGMVFSLPINQIKSFANL